MATNYSPPHFPSPPYFTITMATRIAHIGIAVKNLSASKKTFGDLLDVMGFHEEIVPDQKVSIASFPIGESVIELTEATDPDSSIAKFIAKRGEGIHHVAFEVED